MLKNAIFSFLCLLLAFAGHSQSLKTVIVEGQVSHLVSGSPLANWEVSATTFDSLISNQPVATGFTNAAGNFSLQLEVPDAVQQVIVITRTGCQGPVNGDDEVKLANIDAQNKALANFIVCDTAAVQNCWAYADYQALGNLQVQFFGSASGGIAGNFTYAWDFGDGTTSTEQNPLHTYPAMGYYDVILTTTSSDCQNISHTKVFIWDGGPMDSVLVSGYVYCLPDTTPSAGAFVYGVGSGDHSGQGAGTATSDSTGFYQMWVSTFPGDSTIVLQAFNHWGLPFFVYAQVVNGAATANLYPTCFNQQDTACFAQASFTDLGQKSYQFYGSYWPTDSSQAVSYLWDFGDGTTSTEQNPTHTYAADGTYEVILTASTADCYAVSYLKIFIWDPGPLDSILVSGYVYCSQDSSAAAGVFVYGVGSNDPSGNGSGFAVTDATGFYQMWVLTAPGDSLIYLQSFNWWGLPVTANVPVVNGVASANLYGDCSDVPPFPDCQAIIYYKDLGQNTYEFSADFFPTDPAAQIVYSWDFGDGNTSTEANPTHTYAQDGLYSVSLVALNSSNGDSCVAYANEMVCAFSNNGGNPIDTFYYGCQAMFFANYFATPSSNNIVEFVDVSFGQVVEWAWEFGDGSTSTEQNPVHTYANDGIFTVKLAITTADGCESEIWMEIWVGSNPWNEWDCQAMFIPLPDATGLGFQFYDLSSTDSPVTSWAWDFGDGTTSTDQNPFHVYAQSGIYTVTLAIEADSCNSIFTLELDTDNPLFFNNGNMPVLGLSSVVSKSKNPQQIFDAVKIFPNPTAGDLQIAVETKSAREAELSIVDLSGKILKTSNLTIPAGVSVVREDASAFAEGIYFVRLKTADGLTTLKFTKAGN